MILDGVLAVALIIVVVLQSGKSAGLSGSIAGGAETIFGSKARGFDQILAKMTIVLGILFGAVTLVLAKMVR
jgi:preprotein translocase subunit SecG